MKMIALALLGVLAAAPLAFAQKQDKHAAGGSGPEAQVRQVDRAYFDAYMSDNADAIAKFEDDAVVITNPDGTVSTKQQDVGSIRSGELKFAGGTYDDAQVRVFGDAAVVTGRITVKGTYKGQDISGSYRYTDVFARRGGRWLCVASQSTAVTPATK